MEELVKLVHKIEHLSKEERIQLFSDSPLWKHFCVMHVPYENFFKTLTKEHQYALLTLVILKQADHLLPLWQESQRAKLLALLEKLAEIEIFYASIGGILGYHLAFLKLLKKDITPSKEEISFLHPESYDLTQVSAEHALYLEKTIPYLDRIAYILPVGGAGDRLGLIDEKSQKPLPAAMFNFCGYSLLEWLFKEVQALENLYFQSRGQKISIPMVLMTSDEKDNHRIIQNFLSEKKYFYKNADDIFFCKQPLVPMISEKGKWVSIQPLELCLKPGGHGALWKVLESQKGFEFLFTKNRSYGIIRQINNPIGGMDQNILSLLSYGIHQKKAFGFTTCDRLVGSASGMILLQERKTPKGIEVGHVNIEYSSFNRWDLLDIPKSLDSPYSEYPANTNILFVDLKKAFDAAKHTPFCDMIVNLKNQWEYTDEKGKKVTEKIGRPEIVMQNLSLAFFVPKTTHFKKMDTFLISNIQRKTLSPIKSQPKPGRFLENPASCLYDLLSNTSELLKGSLVQLPPLPSKELFIKKGPSFFVFLSPFLGPLFEKIQNKIFSGIFYKQAELQADLAFLELCHFDVQGSLLIKAYDDQAIPQGQCILKNVEIKNKGLSTNSLENFWKNKLKHREACSIELHKKSAFYAHNVIFEGNHSFIVPENHLLKIEGTGTSWQAKLYPITTLESPCYVPI